MTYWKNSLRENITSIEELRKVLPLTGKEYQYFKKVHRNYPLNISRYYLSLIDQNDLDDPIRKMVIPHIEEYGERGYVDTSGEFDNTRTRGLQHKYRSTILFLLTSSCFSYCRFCFRKRFVGKENGEILEDLDGALAYVSDHREVTNVLLTGGDALFLDNDVLEKVLAGFSKIPHIKFIRLGTRAPVVFPERVITDGGLVELLAKHTGLKRKIIVQTHFNHPRELTSQSVRCINELKNAGLSLQNQSVLLRGVNDDPSLLVELMSGLVSIGVFPYYLFQCRPVRGSMHLQIPIVRGYGIVEEAKSKLSGPAKTFRYIISHRTGKIEIAGLDHHSIYFKYHQAKDLNKAGKFFPLPRIESACWFDEVVHLRERVPDKWGDSLVD